MPETNPIAQRLAEFGIEAGEHEFTLSNDNLFLTGKCEACGATVKRGLQIVKAAELAQRLTEELLPHNCQPVQPVKES